MDSLDQPAGPDPDNSHSLGDGIVDQRAGEAFDRATDLSDLAKLIKGLTAEQRLLLENAWTGAMTQAELAKLLGISDRAVRMRLAALQAWLRAQRDASDTPPQPPQAPGEDSGNAGGEEGQS